MFVEDVCKYFWKSIRKDTNVSHTKNNVTKLQWIVCITVVFDNHMFSECILTDPFCMKLKSKLNNIFGLNELTIIVGVITFFQHVIILFSLMISCIFFICYIWHGIHFDCKKRLLSNYYSLWSFFLKLRHIGLDI